MIDLELGSPPYREVRISEPLLRKLLNESPKEDTMAKAKRVKSAPKPKKPTLRERYETLSATIAEYFKQLRYRRPEAHQISLPATVTGEGGTKRDGVINVPSLLAAVLTAQGLGKEIRLEGVQNGQGGTLYVRFYSPVRVDGVDMLG